MVLSTASTAPSQAAKSKPGILPVALLVLIVVVAIATGIGVLDTSGGPSHYACITISHQGGSVDVSTTGLLHYLDSGYYISCNEGSSLPTNQYKTSCLTISPKTIPATIGVGAATEYYYISSGGSPVTLQGAPAPVVNGTEYINPAGLSLSIAC